MLAGKGRASSIRRRGMTTFATSLAGESGINEDHINPCFESLILNKTLEPRKSPKMNLSSPFPFPALGSFPYARKALESDYIYSLFNGFVHDLTRDVMQYPVRNAVFQSTQSSEKFMGRPCAFLLDTCPSFAKLPPNIIQKRSRKELASRCNCDVLNAKVNTHNDSRTSDVYSLRNCNIEEETSISENKPSSAFFVVRIVKDFPLIIANEIFGSNSAIYGGKGAVPAFDCKSPFIQLDSGERLKARLACLPTFVPSYYDALDNFAGFVSCGANKIGGK